MASEKAARASGEAAALPPKSGASNAQAAPESVPNSEIRTSQNGRAKVGNAHDATSSLQSSTRLGERGTLRPVEGVRKLPRPALHWVGVGGRTALREFDFVCDADAICSWQRETYSLNFPDFRFTEGFANAFRHDLRRAALDPHHGLFVLDEGETVGFLWLVICENSWTGDRYGYVNNLYVTSNRRGQGFSRALMTQAESWFRSQRVKRARLTVTTSNHAACKLYENCGYTTARWEMEKDL